MSVGRWWDGGNGRFQLEPVEDAGKLLEFERSDGKLQFFLDSFRIVARRLFIVADPAFDCRKAPKTLSLTH